MSGDRGVFDRSVDAYEDSYARDSTFEELERILKAMAKSTRDDYDAEEVLNDLVGDVDMADIPGWMFQGTRVYLARDQPGLDQDAMQIDGHKREVDSTLDNAGRTVLFAGGEIAQATDKKNLTHVIVGQDRSGLKALRRKLATYVLSLHPRMHTLADNDQVHQTAKSSHNRLGHEQLERRNET